MRPLPPDFLTHVVEDENGCWIFTGGRLHDHGYVKGGFGRGNERWAHRRAYELAYGPVPAGYQVDHVWDRGCRSRACVYPAHLEAVTPAENSRRAQAHRERKHGIGLYGEGCRCEVCSAAHSAYRERFRSEVDAGIRPIPHGTKTGYTGYACRCDLCRAASTAEAMRYRRSKGVKPRPVAQHGTTSMYTAYKCRCQPCRDNWNAYWRNHRANRRAA